MRALLYRRSTPRYAWTRLVGHRLPRGATGLGSALALAEVPEPRLPGPSWARVRPILSGICGSDLAVITAKGSLYFSALTSFPFVPGHEVVGEVVEVGPAVTQVGLGDRVVVEPALGCVVRGFHDLCAPCQQGQQSNCVRVTQGDIAPGIQTGFCRDTGGGWGASLVAHESQLHRVPDTLSHEAAVIAEPFSCALHGAIQAQVREGGRVLVIGCGTMGLLSIAALRGVAPSCTIVALARHSHQRELAQSLGADHVIAPGRHHEREMARLVGATLHRVILGKAAVLGGYDVVVDCVGSSASLEDAARWTRPRGSIVLVGMPGVTRADLTPLWYQEVRLAGAYAYGAEPWREGQERTFRIALDLLAHQGWGQRLEGLVRHRYPLERYREAIDTALHVGRSGAVKTVFDHTLPGAGPSQPVAEVAP